MFHLFILKISAAEEKFVGVIDEGVSSTRFLVYTMHYNYNNNNNNNIYILLYFINMVIQLMFLTIVFQDLLTNLFIVGFNIHYLQ